MSQKIKTKYRINIKLFLKHTQAVCFGLFKYAFSRYFFAKCVVEEISLVVNEDRVILGLIVNCVINMLLVCYE